VVDSGILCYKCQAFVLMMFFVRKKQAHSVAPATATTIHYIAKLGFLVLRLLKRTTTILKIRKVFA
jgi:hypothetical protein